MIAKCLGQGSSGNCWVLTEGNEKLILDAGLPIMTIKRGIDYNIESVKGVLISHQHSDHSKSALELERMGLEVYKPYESKQSVMRFGSFGVQCFSVPHGDCECYAFYIKNGEHRILYATDFEYIPMAMKSVKLTDIIIECNYQSKYLDMDAENLSHKVLGHCELETCKKFITDNATDSLKTVILTHLGFGTSNGKEMVNEIKKLVTEPCSVFYAEAGKTYQFKDNKCPF